MASAIVTIRIKPVELKTICDALRAYDKQLLALTRQQEPTFHFEGDSRRAHLQAQDILQKIGFE